MCENKAVRHVNNVKRGLQRWSVGYFEIFFHTLSKNRYFQSLTVHSKDNEASSYVCIFREESLTVSMLMFKVIETAPMRNCFITQN